MKSTLSFLLWLLPLTLFSTSVEAAFSCTVTSSGISTAYDPTLASARVVQSSATIACTRAAGDADPMSYTLEAGKGLNPGSTNRAQLGTQLLDYGLFQNSNCSGSWRGSGATTTFSGNLSFNGSLSASTTIAYWACIPAQQTGLAAGTYSDTVTMTLSYGPRPQLTATGALQVNIATPWQCSISTAPTILDFGTYVAFGMGLTASSSFGVTCTNYLPYTIALDATSGVVAGLNYTLAPRISSNTGTGLAQTLWIDGAMAAGQAGTCATATCVETKQHTITVTY